MYSHWQYLHGERIKSRLGCLSGYKGALVGKFFKSNTVFPRIVSAETNLFWKLKLWKFSYNFSIMAIFYFINRIVAAETIEGGQLCKGGNNWQKYGKSVSKSDNRYWELTVQMHILSGYNLILLWKTSQKFERAFKVRTLSQKSLLTEPNQVIF